MTRTDALRGSLDLMVAKMLSRRPRLHGYAIMAAIAGTSGVRVYELTAGGKKQLCGERVALAASAAINRFLREA